MVIQSWQRTLGEIREHEEELRNEKPSGNLPASSSSGDLKYSECKSKYRFLRFLIWMRSGLLTFTRLSDVLDVCSGDVSWLVEGTFWLAGRIVNVCFVPFSSVECGILYVCLSGRTAQHYDMNCSTSIRRWVMTSVLMFVASL